MEWNLFQYTIKWPNSPVFEMKKKFFSFIWQLFALCHVFERSRNFLIQLHHGFIVKICIAVILKQNKSSHQICSFIQTQKRHSLPMPPWERRHLRRRSAMQRCPIPPSVCLSVPTRSCRSDLLIPLHSPRSLHPRLNCRSHLSFQWLHCWHLLPAFPHLQKILHQNFSPSIWLATWHDRNCLQDQIKEPGNKWTFVFVFKAQRTILCVLLLFDSVHDKLQSGQVDVWADLWEHDRHNSANHWALSGQHAQQDFSQHFYPIGFICPNNTEHEKRSVVLHTADTCQI